MFALVESSDAIPSIPRLITYTKRGDARLRNAAYESSEVAKHDRVSSACRYVVRAQVVTRALLAEPRSTGNEETWIILVSRFPPDEHADEFAVAAAAAALRGPPG